MVTPVQSQGVDGVGCLGVTLTDPLSPVPHPKLGGSQRMASESTGRRPGAVERPPVSALVVTTTEPKV